MNSVTQEPRLFNLQDKTAPTALSVLDLIDYQLGHHQEQAAGLTQLAQWHRERAAALAAERQSLAADVAIILGQAEDLLR